MIEANARQQLMSRSSFMRLLNTVVSGSDSKESSQDSPRKLLPRMNTEIFNDNDEECIEYVRDFKAKVVLLSQLR